MRAATIRLLIVLGVIFIPYFVGSFFGSINVVAIWTLGILVICAGILGALAGFIVLVRLAILIQQLVKWVITGVWTAWDDII